MSETFSCLLLSRDWKSWMKSLASNEQWVETNVYICHPLLLLQEWAEWTLTQHLCRSNSQNLVCRDVIASKNYSFNHPVIKPSTSSLSTTEWCFFTLFPSAASFREGEWWDWLWAPAFWKIHVGHHGTQMVGYKGQSTDGGWLGTIKWVRFKFFFFSHEFPMRTQWIR